MTVSYFLLNVQISASDWRWNRFLNVDIIGVVWSPSAKGTPGLWSKYTSSIALPLAARWSCFHPSHLHDPYCQAARHRLGVLVNKENQPCCQTFILQNPKLTRGEKRKLLGNPPKSVKGCTPFLVLSRTAVTEGTAAWCGLLLRRVTTGGLPKAGSH